MLDTTNAGYQLSGIEIRHKRAKPKVLSSLPRCEIVDVHRREVPCYEGTGVHFFHSYGGLTKTCS